MMQYHLTVLAVLAFQIVSCYQEREALCVMSLKDIEAKNESPCEADCTFFGLKEFPLDSINMQYHAVDIYLCSREYNSSDVSLLKFANYQEVNIMGLGENRSVFNCQNEESGLQFQSISTVNISDISLNQCGFEVEDAETNITAGVFIANSTNIRMSNVMIQNSPGIGLALINGYINITDSLLDHSLASNSTKLGGGMQSGSQSRYNIHDCHFTNNTSSKPGMNSGGLLALFGAGAQNTHMTITDSRFIGNQAENGGALHISFCNSASNKVVVKRSHFENNVADKKGGAVLVSSTMESKTAINHFQFSSCHFLSNVANSGGGIYVAAPDHYNHNPSNFTFFNSTWLNNSARYGSAVLITPSASYDQGVFPVLLFHDCKFINNTFKKTKESFNTNYEIERYGTGTLYVNIFTIDLIGRVDFMGNTNNAIYLLSSKLVVSAGSRLLFDRNLGYQGGAIHMNTFFSIDLNDNTTVIFTNNHATDRGGAIYHVAPHDLVHLNMQNCFLKYAGSENDVVRRNISVIFDNNKIRRAFTNITEHRESIFLYSLLPCHKAYRVNSGKCFHKIASATFKQDDDCIATFGSEFKVQKVPSVMIPGIEAQLDILTLDDLNATVRQPVYKVVVTPHLNYSSCITLDPAYSVITSNKIRLNGDPGCGGEVKLKLINKPDISLSFNITLRDCPAGYVFIKSKAVCQCSANTASSTFAGIQRCNHTSNQARLVHGYWAGYVRGHFRTSGCPLGYCTNANDAAAEISLPHVANNFSDLLCSKNRFGIICAKCNNGTSVHYNPMYKCLDEKKCNLGILFFVLSQILPATILFLTVIFCNIQLTTGELNGFIFYVQLFSVLTVSADNVIDFPDGTKALLTVLNFIVSIFNLKFFNISQLSFCLFEGATSLDVIAFDYITVVYSLLLIILTVIFLNLKCYGVNKCLQKLNKRETHFSQSILHGLSGFLILCYARTTTTTLKILTLVWLRNEGPHRVEIRVFYYAEMEYFKGDHLKYAIPALFALIFMSLLPPMLLLIYPLCYKVLAFLRLEESKLSKALCTAVPLEKFKPFFDSFQGEFKDNHRYFAGLYFVYRLSTLITFTFVSNLVEFYLYVEIQLIITLALHAWVQPYKRRLHNKMDLYIFTLLLIVNSITLCNYQWTLNHIDKQPIIEAFSTIQVVLAYSPIMIIIIFFLGKLKVKAFIKRQRNKFAGRTEKDLTLSLSMFDERQLDYSEVNYQECTSSSLSVQEHENFN